MRDLTGSPLSRRLGRIIDEAQAAARNPYAADYRDVAALFHGLLNDVMTDGRRVTGRVGTWYRYTMILDWKDTVPTLTLRDLDADTDTGYQDTTMDANADTFRVLYLAATR